jgi:hypothetical protein
VEHVAAAEDGDWRVARVCFTTAAAQSIYVAEQDH